MISDFGLFIQNVLKQAVTKSPNLGASLMNPDTNARDAYLAEVVGNGLAAMFETDGSSKSVLSEGSARNLSPGMAAHYEELLERNAAMAGALGACECWGEVDDCEICMGAGKPGWAIPNKRLFSRLIRPALRALRESSYDRVTVSQNHVSN
jgi:hypothetical protein